MREQDPFRYLPPFDTDIAMTLVLLISAFLRPVTPFFTADNFRMCLAPHLPSVKYRNQQDKNSREGVFDGKSSKRQKACGATRTQQRLLRTPRNTAGGRLGGPETSAQRDAMVESGTGASRHPS